MHAVPILAASALLALASDDSASRSLLASAVTAALMGLVFLGVGALAYSGVWRWWARMKRPIVTMFYFPYLPLAIGWLGVGLLIIGAFILFPPAARLPVIYLGIFVEILAVCSAMWMPRALLPRWYRAAKGLDGSTSSDRRYPISAGSPSPTQAGAGPAAQGGASGKDETAVNDAVSRTFGSAD
ncbi:hypothetical protein [Clavibacter sp. CFBP 8614]|uniref:hypothetical protein n=1 Tax=unclassified Clavibacter TaxID=2626594 RepID=UPI0040411A13